MTYRREHLEVRSRLNKVNKARALLLCFAFLAFFAAIFRYLSFSKSILSGGKLITRFAHFGGPELPIGD
jgi:hypothetical protein